MAAWLALRPGPGCEMWRHSLPAGLVAAHGSLSGSWGAGGSPSPAEVGSYGSHGRRGSFFDRFVRDREAAASSAAGGGLGVQPSGLSASSGLGRPPLEGARQGPAPASSKGDIFAKILPERWAAAEASCLCGLDSAGGLGLP